jgi:hypothetical protein
MLKAKGGKLKALIVRCTKQKAKSLRLEIVIKKVIFID